MKKNPRPYILSVLAALAVGGLSALLTRGGMGLYEQINRPPLSPPPVVFPVVWTVLFILMGISAAMVWENRDKAPEAVKSALRTYDLQLGVNFLWSIIFFNFKAFTAAFFWLLLLWGLIISMITKFNAIRPTAAALQLPYLIWVTFAGYLTFAICVLNK